MKTRFKKDDLMAMLDSVEDAVVKLDGDAKYVAMNKAAADTFRRLGKTLRRRLANRCGSCFQTSKARSLSDNCGSPCKMRSPSNSSSSIPATNISTKYRAIHLYPTSFWCFGTSQAGKATHSHRGATERSLPSYRVKRHPRWQFIARIFSNTDADRHPTKFIYTPAE
jgi:hypothetical protein